jgi:hypothetical protein
MPGVLPADSRLRRLHAEAPSVGRLNLREYMDRKREPLEETLRRVIREELRVG